MMVFSRADTGSTPGADPPKLVTKLEGGSALFSPSALESFRIAGSEIGFEKDGITPQKLLEAMKTAPESYFKVDVIGDGVIRFQREHRDISTKQLWVSIAGMQSPLGKVTVGKEGEITNFSSWHDSYKERIEALLHCSPSHEITLQLLKMLGSGPNLEPGAAPSDKHAKALELCENEAALVNKSGDAVVLSLNTPHYLREVRKDQVSPQDTLRIIAARSGINHVQTRGLECCAAFIAQSDDLSLLFHARGNFAFDTLLEQAQILASRSRLSWKPLKSTLVTNERGSDNACNGMLVDEAASVREKYGESARAFHISHQGAILEKIDSAVIGLNLADKRVSSGKVQDLLTFP